MFHQQLSIQHVWQTSSKFQGPHERTSQQDQMLCDQVDVLSDYDPSMISYVKYSLHIHKYLYVKIIMNMYVQFYPMFTLSTVGGVFRLLKHNCTHDDTMPVVSPRPQT